MNKYIYTFYCFIISITATFSQTNDCNHPDYDALVTFNQALNGDNWINKWDLSDCNICDWYGVICDKTNERVFTLDLSNNNLVGVIPSDIKRLSNLFFLKLPDNKLKGEIPVELKELTNLLLLNLSNNNLTGNIPSFLGKMISLRGLSLSHNNLSGNIPSELGFLESIESFNLSNNQLSGEIPPNLSNIGIARVNPLLSFDLSFNNLTGCFPKELSVWCTNQKPIKFFSIDFLNNPNLPLNGDFFSFCNSGEGSCEDNNTADCVKLNFTSENEQIIINNLPSQSTIEIIGSNTNWQTVPICNGNCSETKTIPDLIAGEYTVKVQLIGKDGSYCYREEKVMVSGNGNGGGNGGGNGNGNTGENANCNNLKFTGEGGQIKIEDLNAAYNKVEIIGRNTDWRIRTICDGNCTDTQLIPNLSAGEYAVKVHQVGADGVYCYREEKVNVTGGGVNGNNGNTSNTANCNNVSFSSTNGQIAVAGLTAAYDKVEIIGRNTNWQVQTICDGNCTDTQIIPNLSNGAYTVKVNQGGNDGSYCYREESINVSTSNTSRTNHKIHLASYQKAQKVALQWTANHLAATKYFLVERSIDGATFEPLTLIKNIENNSLHWTDEQPQKGKNHYRVRQVLNNHQTIYSTVRSETFFLGGETITLFPNPAKDQLSIHTAFLKGKEGTIQIYNAYGQSVTQQNKVSFETPYQSLDISTLENGIYWLSIQVGTQPMISKRFVVEHWR